jgi:hypothetical protein
MCGILAYSGIDNYSKDAIKLGLLAMMWRGMDATGWYANGVITKEATQVDEFLASHEVPDGNLIIAHVRKATYSGTAKDQDKAHPFQYENIVGVHNGTLVSHYQIAKDLKMDKWDLDSQVLIYGLRERNNYQVLKDISGSAAIVWIYADDPNALYFYRNSERPLYRGSSPTGRGVYIASTKEALTIIGCKNILEVKDFYVYRMFDGEIDLVNSKKIVIPIPKTIKRAALGEPNGSIHAGRHGQLTMTKIATMNCGITAANSVFNDDKLNKIRPIWYKVNKKPLNSLLELGEYVALFTEYPDGISVVYSPLLGSYTICIKSELDPIGQMTENSLGVIVRNGTYSNIDDIVYVKSIFTDEKDGELKVEFYSPSYDKTLKGLLIWSLLNVRPLTLSEVNSNADACNLRDSIVSKKLKDFMPENDDDDDSPPINALELRPLEKDANEHDKVISNAIDELNEAYNTYLEDFSCEIWEDPIFTASLDLARLCTSALSIINAVEALDFTETPYEIIPLSSKDLVEVLSDALEQFKRSCVGVL